MAERLKEQGVAEQLSQREYWSGKVGDEWANHAARIDVMLAPVTEAAFGAISFTPGERVLDIGCGAGFSSLAIARRVGESGTVVGVDLSPQLLRVARDRAGDTIPQAKFVEADASEVTFGQPFDAAFSRFGVMFFEEPARAFAHIRRLLRPDGRLGFICWRPLLENAWATVPIGAVEPMLKAPLPKPNPDAPGPFAFADGAKVERILQSAGWRDIALTHWSGPISIGGDGPIEAIATFLLKIGPCARAINDQGLDAEEAHGRVMERLAPLHSQNRVMLDAACWIVTAKA